MQAFPVFLSLQGRRALIVGGGDAAARKAELLLKAGAQVSLVASTVGGEIAQLIAEAQMIVGRQRPRIAARRERG